LSKVLLFTSLIVLHFHGNKESNAIIMKKTEKSYQVGEQESSVKTAAITPSSSQEPILLTENL
jgi:hypothetical protein